MPTIIPVHKTGEIVMLEKIYLYISNLDKKELEEFTFNMKNEKIKVSVLDKLPADISMENALLVSDDILTGVKYIGYGMSYSGEASYIIESLENISAQYFRMIFARFSGTAFVAAETERLIIREITVEDLPQLYEVYETLKDCQFVEPLYEYQKEKEFTINYIKNMYAFFNYGLWLVFEKESGELIGRVGLENREIDGISRVELGYLIRKDKQRQGFAYEAAKAAIEYAVNELALEEIFLCCEDKNKPSAAFAQKLGFSFYAAASNGMLIFSRKLV